jgi:hypothetical protein
MKELWENESDHGGRNEMAGLKGKSGPPGNMNAFKHGLAAIQKRLEEGVPNEETVRMKQIRLTVTTLMLAFRLNHLAGGCRYLLISAPCRLSIFRESAARELSEDSRQIGAYSKGYYS